MIRRTVVILFGLLVAGSALATDLPQTARITLERVVDGDQLAHKRGKLVRWMTGAAPQEVLARPYGVAWEGRSLLVTDPGAGRVVRIDRRDRVTASPPGAFRSPIGVAVCESAIVVTDSERGDVTLLDGKLQPVRTLATDLERPTGVACSGGRIYAVETGRHRILVLDLQSPAAQPVDSIGIRGAGPGEFNFPAAMACSRGALWVGDTLNFRIQQLEAEGGSHVSTFGELGDAPGEMPRIKGLAVDHAGHVWVSDAHLDEVALFDDDGTFLMHLDGFSFPAGIAAHPDGLVAVVDSLNRRVQIFRVARDGT